MQSSAEQSLLDFLGVQSMAAGWKQLDAANEGSDQERAAKAIAEIRERLMANPREVLAEAPAALGDRPSLEDGIKLLNDAEAALRTPRGTLKVLASNQSSDSYELPEKYRFPGYDPAAIPIQPSTKKFESAADAPAWAATAAMAWMFRLVTEKPELPRPAATAEYPLTSKAGRTTIALFSDWGTGYYHSRYIANHIIQLEVAQAIHLGDVYYTGTSKQFAAHFTPPLDAVIRSMPMYALNANHEMDSRGIPYLRFLADKQAMGTASVPQPQESSYFCLVNDFYQVIGIDTAFYGNGRYKDKQLRDWLHERLVSGRQSGKTTVLLSQSEPYGPSGGASVAARELRDLYVKDLSDWAQQGLIHAWFWGDEHYAALYRPSNETPFVGSCIGHGGYPFGRRADDSKADDVAQVAWAETGSRFPEDTGQRQDRGNNGFCVLDLGPDGVAVTYWDWLRRKRHEARLQRVGERLELV